MSQQSFTGYIMHSRRTMPGVLFFGPHDGNKERCLSQPNIHQPDTVPGPTDEVDAVQTEDDISFQTFSNAVLSDIVS